MDSTTNRRRLVLLGLTAGLLAPVPALAQTDPAPAASDSAAAASDATVEEIVVTAQKREESLQDVPIAISALSANMLESRGISGTEGLTAVVPGLQLPRTYSSQTPFIRGIGSINSSTGEESANAIYVDGVYRPSLPGGLFNFNSVERVEVLKGPQGTLFGRNALGGVINIITRNPSFEPRVDMQIGYGRFDTVESSLYATTGLTENLAADVAVYYKDQGKGFVRNLVNGDDVFKGKEFSVRSKLRWESPDNRTEAVVSVDYNKFYADTGVNTNAYGDALLTGGQPNQGYYVINTNFGPLARTEQYGGSFTLRHDLDWARFVSISAYRKLKPLLLADQDGTPTQLVDITQDNPQRTLTQEFQLLSASDSKIAWVLGLYYFDDIARNDPLLLQGAAFGANRFRRGTSRQASKSYAGFAQATVPVLTDTNITAGIRYTKDKKHVTGQYTTAPVFGQPESIIPGTVADQSASFSKVTYRFVLDHNFTEDLMAYASYSRGFKSGVFTLVTPTDPAVKPSVLDAFEVGFKSQFLGDRLRLNGSAFFYKYDNIQINTVNAGVSRLVNAAKSEVKGFDLDAEAVITRDFRLQASMTYLHGRYKDFPNAPVYVPRRDAAGVPTGGNVLTVADLAGNTTIQTPKLTANVGAQYEIGPFHLAGNVSYNDGWYWNADNRLAEPSIVLVSSSLTWTSPDKDLDIEIWGRNLLNEKYHSYATAGGVGDIGSPALPRTYGVRLGMHF